MGLRPGSFSTTSPALCCFLRTHQTRYRCWRRSLPTWHGGRYAEQTHQCGDQSLSSCSSFLSKRALGPPSAACGSFWTGLRSPWLCDQVAPALLVISTGRCTYPKAVGAGATEFQGHLDFLFISSELIEGNFTGFESLTNFLFLSPSLPVSLIFSFGHLC